MVPRPRAHRIAAPSARGAWWSAAYFDAAHDAVALIVAAVEAWADQPLRAVVEHDWGLARQ